MVESSWLHTNLSCKTWKISFLIEDWHFFEPLLSADGKESLEDWQHKISPNGLISHLLFPLVVRNKMVRQTPHVRTQLSKTNDHFSFKIQFMILFSRQGKLRLQKWFASQPEKSKKKMSRELIANILTRKPKMCSFLEWKDLKVVYKRYDVVCFLFKRNLISKCHFLDMLVCTFAVPWSKLTMNWWHWKSSIDT